MFSGVPSLAENNDRKISAAVKHALDELEGRQAQPTAFAGGIPDIVENGAYNDDGTWSDFGGCGDPLGECVCGP